MRRTHFEAFQPVCPRCRTQGVGERALTLATVVQEVDDDVLEGVLHCPEASCRLEFPIIDGIPLIVPNPQGFVTDNLPHLLERDDLSPVLMSLLNDCAGPGSVLEVARQHLSTYTWDAYAEFDPAEAVRPDDVAPGGVVRCLERGLTELGRPLRGPVLDIGCSVGRTCFELAGRTDDLVLGVDMSVPMLRVASRVLRTSKVRYPRRRVGIVYDEREFSAPVAHRERVDFWACDVLALPFRDASIGHATALNVLDCVGSPVGMLMALEGLLRPGGTALLSTPYDWSPAATAPAGWIGGHSQRADGAGASEPLLDSLLAGGGHPSALSSLRRIAWLEHFPWSVRMHERSSVTYDVHILGLERGES